MTGIANEWHLLNKIADKIYPYQSDVNIGLLIGYISPKAIKTREVMFGKGDSPYAVRTLLGWGITGPIIPQRELLEDSKEQSMASCNLSMTQDIDNDILLQYQPHPRRPN